MPRRTVKLLAASAALLTSAITLTGLPSAAQAAPAGAPAVQQLCGTPAPGTFGCFADRRTDVKTSRIAAVTTGPQGYGPSDLRSAYALPADGGAGATVAIIDAYDDPAAESDLAAYRAQYGLPECTTANGCFSKVDQRGGTDYPEPDDGWAGEISLDLDMVSAVAPQAHILLVESDTNATEDLGAAVNMAVALGAKYVSNSYGGYDDEVANQAFDSAYFDHPGTVIVASAGDGGYGVSYPASSPYVTAVGGTTLTKDDSARGWHERVWNTTFTSSDGEVKWGATGSGCSTAEPKPSWQSDPDCPGRSVADVSAVADPTTGVAVYNTYSDAGWNVYGGTSASAPIIAGVYALAGAPVEGSTAAEYPYDKPSALNDVTEGDDASCADASLCGFGTTPVCTPTYACQAGPGYDGPTGLGTPEGVGAFQAGPHGSVAGTVTDAATGKPVVGATVTLGDYHATSAADGTYTLTVPTGSYDLKVAAFGYAALDLGTVTVGDGTTVSANVKLTAVPTRTISGVVTDGGARGWGLYAKITIDGVPGETETDPATGKYAVKVPLGATYTLHTTALYPGYQAAAATVTIASSNVTTNFALPIDETGTLAPGYQIGYHGGGLQSFDDSTIPSGWTVKNNVGTGGWQFDDTLNRGNQTGGTGHFASVDDFALGWSPADTELISPQYDFSAETKPQLSFRTALPSLYRLSDLTADVDVSTDDGASWTTVWHHTDVVSGPSLQTVPLDAYAGDPDVHVRFHYTTEGLSGTWEIDDVAVGTRTLETPAGGLLVGHVTDGNTDQPVAGATVATATGTGRSVTGGLYWLFTEGTGKQAVTADLAGFGYPAVTGKATVKQNQITSLDFALQPASLKVHGGAVAEDVPWGSSRTVQVTVANKGGSQATLSLGGQEAGTAVATGAGTPRTRKASSVTPLQAATVATSAATVAGPADDAAWQSVADLPSASYGGLAAVNDGVLYAGLGEAPGGQWLDTLSKYDAGADSWTALKAPATRRFTPAYGFIRGKLYVTGGVDAAGNLISGGEVYDPATNTWSVTAAAPKSIDRASSAVVGDKLYVIGGCETTYCGRTDVQIYDPATDSWSDGPRYPLATSFTSCATVDGTLTCAGGVNEPASGSPEDTAAGYKLASDGTWQRIADAPIDFWGAAATSADGKLLSAGGTTISGAAVTNEAFAYDPASDSWSALPNLPQPSDLASAAPGWFVVGGWYGYSELSSVVKLPGYDHPHGTVPWLSFPDQTLTVKAGGTVTIPLTLDATTFGPADAGDHQAALLIDTDTPYGSLRVPVTMTVTPPKNWTHLVGTVTGPSTATVQVVTKAGTTTVTTAADGTYSVWLPSSRGTATVTVTADGYRPAASSVSLVKNGVVTQDFTLQKS